MARLLRTAVLALAALAALPSTAWAQAAASDYTSAVRYDEMNRIVGTIAPDPDGSGALHFGATRTTYDIAGRATRVETGELSAWQSESVVPSTWILTPLPGGVFTVFSQVDTVYDGLDRKLKVTLSSGGTAYQVTQFSYDAVGRPDCTAVRMNPAVFGSLPASACSAGTAGSFGPDRITRNVYDDAGQLLRVQKGYGTSLQQDYVTYTYSDNGKPLTVKDADGNRASYTYDGLDRLAAWNFPDKVTTGAVSATDYEAYTYDANGNRLTQRKRDGRTFSYAYDALNRATAKIVPDGCAPIQVGACPAAAATRDVYYGYDVRGLQIYARFDSASGSDGVMSGYTGFGELTSSTTAMGGISRTFGYGYDADGDRLSVTHPDGAVFSYVYDGLDRLTALQPPGSYIPVATYNAAGYQTKRTAVETLVYDPVGRLASKTMVINGTNDYAVSLSYNPASQIVGRTQSDGYAFTGYVGVSRSYAANGLNQYVSAGPATFTYDANGNLTGDGTSGYGYDAENRLVTRAGGVTLDYDATGRLWRTSGGASGTTQYLYDGDQMTVEYDGAGMVLRRYMHGNGNDDPVLWYEGASTANTAWRVLIPDFQGSIITAFTNAGVVMGTSSYDEYGIPAATNFGRFQYTGQAWLPDLGMYYYKARIYSPTLGRFLQTDPIGYADQNNLYAYVGNDPIDGADPSGQTCISGSWSNGDSAACQRALYYAKIASDPRISSRTTFFSAASAVVNTLASVNLQGSALSGVSDVTRAFLEQSGERLAAANILRASQIASGQLYGGSTSVAQNDRNFIRFEQRNLQGQLDAFKSSNSAGYSQVISEVNSVLNGSIIEGTGSLFGTTDRNVRSAIDGVRRSLGRDIDFSKMSDRVAIGDRLTSMSRAGRILCTGSIIRTC